ncbi:putative LRR receptor-like serine/threonine-protein kinase [Platanthera guangdongensis]|uniref:LRR receptor-like serine/threonine-protein kinase n=1 Tax=Platanthera guangdongensis TaxID=2320717 RepID=A0ABR2N511_9ASPA
MAWEEISSTTTLISLLLILVEGERSPTMVPSSAMDRVCRPTPVTRGMREVGNKRRARKLEMSVEIIFASRTPRAVNTILERWGKKASGAWNLSGDLCTGAAIDNTGLDDPSFNPGIKCDCSSINDTLCHIVQFKVYALDVVGTIPEELSNLTYLFTLDLRQNYLTGPLPAFIGNFSSMQYLSFGINALSGPIPKELGKLQKLVSLGMGANNFSGPLPPELGALTSLNAWYMDSCGASGELPPSLSNLKSLETLWASDINFTGKIPDFIGGWTNLTTLARANSEEEENPADVPMTGRRGASARRCGAMGGGVQMQGGAVQWGCGVRDRGAGYTQRRIQGNSFSGPIPSSFSGLSKMTDLRIGDLINGSSSLAFINNMTSLTTLILRNSKISDTLPSDFEKYNSLLKL